ncbi:uncharacterized protein PV07_11148 [Cladophialophora immunda]|uniref:C2H2-type domain-containing protein n=1 Tax=Cladophialophora immunda TaxID=569365 RepID=A0A0D2BX24_9EURO|nr:uncharacterized protein PV07_11148 [Cladophialophora immunda]KIW22900.1 hypothetical protein PV07_11148 [Cladophialophora immunda]OQU93830.1 Fungal specific transcription factor domain-containing protein [Cladophialophora immunda]
MPDPATVPAPKDGPRGRRGAKIRQCSTCGRTFAKTDHLERHVRSHTKEKPFVCGKCGRKYGRHDTLLRHQKDHSADDISVAVAEGKRRSSNPLGPEDDQRAFSANPMPLHSATILSEQPDPILISNISSSLDAPATDYLKDGKNYQEGQMASNTSTDVYSNNVPSDQSGSGFDTSIDVFNFDFEAQFPSWLVDSDLHGGILDTPLVATMAELRPSWPESPYATFGSSNYKPVSNTKRLWFMANDDAQDEVTRSGPATPPGSRDEVDDTYRQTLTQSLQIRPIQEQTLPSADFLNLCVRSYFARFHPVFPVVHAPTFRPSKANSMVLLSICSVGSLFTGSVHAIRQGVHIFERLHKAVLANWDRLIAQGVDQRISLIQTAIIGQTFGLLSGEPRHLAIVDAFNGTLISWARRWSTFKTKKMVGLDLNVSSTELDKKWREWAKNEELIRIALSVHIHDAELAAMFHHEPFLRHNSRQLPVAASNQTFMATRPEDWRQSYLNDPSNFESMDSTPASIDAHLDFDLAAVPSNSYFTAYTVLEGICANIIENRINARSTPSRTEEMLNTLTSFYRNFLQESAAWEADHMDMSILWHLAFMIMFADFDLLERAIGRNGPDLSPEDQLAVTAWANSDHAKRCVIHGLIVQKKLENLPLGFEPAIHVPRAMFRAGIAWFCYTRFGSQAAGQRTAGAAEALEFPEFKTIGVNPALLLFQASGYKHGKPTTTETNAALSGLTDLLRRIGHWEIARRFAAILGALLHNEAD